MEVLDLIKKRWSPRALKNEPVSEQQINVILEAASYAFSAGNLQPWHYTYAVHGTEGFQKILHTLFPGNQPWAKNAYILMITSAKTKDNPSAVLDLGSANMNLALQAFSMGIYSHFMGGFDKIKAREVAGLGEEYSSMAVVALGYPDSADTLESPYKEREVGPKGRNPVDSFSEKI